MNKIYLYIFSFVKLLVKITPNSILNPFLNLFADFVRLCDAKHRKIMMINLNLAYGESISLDEKQRIIKACYRNLLYNGIDFIRNSDTTKEAILEKVDFVGEEKIKDLLSSKRPIIFQSAHYGNWELVPLSLAAKYGPVSGVGRKLDSPALNEIVRKNREQFDIELLDKKGAMKPMLRAIKNGRKVGLLVDQDTPKKASVLVEFFGHKTRHTPAASIIARRVGGVIVPIFISTNDHKRYTLTIYDPIETEETENIDKDIFKLTQAQASITESVIREKPEEWFWFHRRWKGENKSEYGIKKKVINE